MNNIYASQDAEQAVLGSLLLNNRMMIEVIGRIQPDDFYDFKHQIIYEHIYKLWETGDPADTLTVQKSLLESQVLDKVGGPVYITQLFDRVPSSENASHYAGIVRVESDKRKLHNMLNAGLISIKGPDFKVDESIDHIVGNLLMLNQQQPGINRSRSQAQIMPELREIIEQGKEIKRVKTGIDKLDEIIDGFQRQDLIIIAAPTGQGKTTFTMNLALNIARYPGPVLFYSLEMSELAMESKILSTMTGINSRVIHRNVLNSDDKQQVLQATRELETLPLHIGEGSRSLSNIREDVRYWHKYYGQLSLVIVDYLQIVPSPLHKGGEYERLTQVSMGLKQIATDFDCPMIAISQFSREGSGLNNLKGSGQIENDGGVVILITTAQDDVSTINVAKNRHGETGFFRMRFRKTENRFTPYQQPLNSGDDNDDL